ncbi:uncharacterized protein LOC106668864 isoform X2 [Cimex lectularius]|uniref:Uncharacterized protein n=1 Tax=Cimex lectularius TaxID=79782 RepID=A0A8I6RY83_CIMLE|nr:uncharacterized protein LOC106668864 isoform X2 [Cimex lectularius]
MKTPAFAILAIVITLVSAGQYKGIPENNDKVDNDMSFIKGNFNWQKHVRSLTNSSVHSLSKRSVKNKAKHQKLQLAKDLFHRVKRSLEEINYKPLREYSNSRDVQMRQARNVNPEYIQNHQDVYTVPFRHHHPRGKYHLKSRVRREKLLNWLKMIEMRERLKRNILSKSQSDGHTTPCYTPKTKCPTTKAAKCITTTTCKTTTTKCPKSTTPKPCISTKKCIVAESDTIDSISNFKRQSPFTFHQKKKRAFRKPYSFMRSRLNKEMLESLLERM